MSSHRQQFYNFVDSSSRRSKARSHDFVAESQPRLANAASPASGQNLVTASVAVIRTAHRTLLAKLVAICLLVLAASPVTAPFSVIDSFDDFNHSQPGDVHHPAHDMAEGHVKVSPHLVVTAPDLTPALSVAAEESAAAAVRPIVPARAPRALSAVLRL